MSAPRDPDAIIAAWLDEGPTVLPDVTRRSIAVSNRVTKQSRRPRWLPWRDTDVNSYLKLAVAGAAVVAVAVGSLYLINRGPTGVGSGGGPTPPPTPSLTPPPPSGITGWTTYTSDVYGLTLAYPDGWSLTQAATRKWQPGDRDGSNGWTDWFTNPSSRDGGEIVFMVWQQPAGSDADITTREDLASWVGANACYVAAEACETAPDMALPMCAGKTACLPAILVPLPEDIVAAFPAENGMVNVVQLLRHDSFPATARYGGGVELLKSILTTMDVWTPGPGQVPSP